MLKQAEAIDDVTVVFEMERPFAIWSYTMAVTGIVPEHAYGTDYGTHPIGSGRYILKQWDKGQQGDSGSQPGLLWGCAEDAAGHDSLYGRGCGICGGARRAGGCGVHGGVLSQTSRFQNSVFWTVRRWTTVDLTSGSAGDGTGGWRKIGNDFTADVQVRRAINLAIDRQEMIDHVLNGYGSPAYSVCDKMPWYNDEMENISYDVEKAEEDAGCGGMEEKC